MFELLDSFRIRFAGRPFLLCLALAAGAWLVIRQTPHGRWISSRALERTLAVISVLALISYFAIVVVYARDEHYFDAAEPTMTAVGWLFALGRPIYHTVDSAERYAHMYGPMAFIAHGLALREFGPGIGVSKGLAAVAALLSLGCTFLALRTAVSRWSALTLTGACALFYLMFRNYTFWTRPEPLQLLCVGVGLLGSVARHRWIGAVALGVSAGVLWNLKITGPLYTLPLLALLVWRDGRARLGAAIGAVVLATIVAVLPFALPNVSLGAYLAWIELSSRNGLLLAMLRQNIEWAAFLLLPLLVSYYGAAQDDRPSTQLWRGLVAALVIGIGGVAVAASKPGAGIYHLLPFAPIVVYAVALVLRDREALPASQAARVLALSCAIAAVVVAVAQQASFLRIMHARDATGENADLRAFLQAHPGLVVEMGYNGDDRLTFARPELVFRNGSYLIDTPAVQEHQLSGVALPPATIDAIRSCRADVWLVPRGTAPFEGPNRYPAMNLAPLFPDAFRAAFAEAYAHDGATRYYDVWRCRARSTR
jgi:hypothetical protein